MKKILLYIVYGDDQGYYDGAKYSFLTFMNWIKVNDPIDIVVLTEKPEEFSQYPITTLPLSTQQKDNWSLNGKYHFRIKNRGLAYVMDHLNLTANDKILFLDTDTAVKEQPELFKKYFAKIIPPEDNKFAALNSAVWSGGSFIYIPPGVKVDMPLQAYFRINAENIGQFERTLIIADEGSEVHYIEGCTAPVYSSESLHVAVVELLAHKDAKLRYTTIQNWSNDVYNLVTKRAYAYEGATVEWIDGNIGSKLTMKYPGIYLMGRKAYGETLSIAFAGKNQHQDTGAKMVHLAPDTTSKVTSKSVSRANGRSTYRGLLKVAKGATNVKATVRCDALLLDDTAKTDTYPYMEIDQEDATVTHEATVGKIGDEQIFYLMSRGFSEDEALSLIVNGFMEPFTKELPMEYAVELNRLIKLEMDNSVG